MTVLALDVGNKTGWARGDGARVESGVQDFTPRRTDLPGIRWFRFTAWLIPMSEHVEHIITERWTSAPGIAGKISAGYVTRVEEVCAMQGMIHQEVSPAELKRWATGKGNASKREMVDAVLSRRGWTDKLALGYDEADALALLHFSLAQMA